MDAVTDALTVVAALAAVPWWVPAVLFAGAAVGAGTLWWAR